MGALGWGWGSKHPRSEPNKDLVPAQLPKTVKKTTLAKMGESLAVMARTVAARDQRTLTAEGKVVKAMYLKATRDADLSSRERSEGVRPEKGPGWAGALGRDTL